jgi:hemolysin D
MPQDTPAPAEGTISAVRPPQDSALSELLAQEPSRITRRFLYALLFAFCAGIVAASVLKIDVTITAPAVLLPSGKALLIQPEIAGTIVEIRVKEGDTVRAGDVLAVLESEKGGEQLFALSDAAQKLRNAERVLNVVVPEAKKQAEDQIKNLQGQLAHLNRERDQLQNKERHERQANQLLTEVYTEQRRKLDEADRRADAGVQTADENLSYRKKQMDAFERLLHLQSAGQLEMLNARRELFDAQAAADKARSQKREGGVDRLLAEKNHQREEQQHRQRLAELSQQLERNGFESRAAQLSMLKIEGEVRLREINAQTSAQSARFDFQLARQKADAIRSDQNRELVRAVAEGRAPPASRLMVVAPVAGRIGTVQVRKQGEAIERGKTMFTLLPQGELIAEVSVANRDVALVEAGQVVKLKLDAFPFAEYGSVRGEVTNVPPEAEGLDSPNNSFYRATASLNAQQVRKHGKTIDLLAGMTATAEIVTDRKTLLQFVLTPLLEPFQK